ncbi:MAG: hypothetical protein FVQ81_02035 [Candidatus Glassbacteria bacterium]|nr:hypothetical protein [Candidatus Glassbacteria bacterium]
MKTILMILLFPALLWSQVDTVSILREKVNEDGKQGLIVAISAVPFRTVLDTVGWWGPTPKTRPVLMGDVYSEPDSLGNRVVWRDYKIQHNPDRVDVLNDVVIDLTADQIRYKKLLVAGKIRDKDYVVDSKAVADDVTWKVSR